MSKLFMHGSGMLKRIPISFGDWKWDVSQSWISLLELGSCQPVFEEKKQEDYLVVEISYLVESKFVLKPEGEIYTRNQKNITQGLVQEEEAYFSLLEEKPEAWEEAFQKYIQWISACFEPQHIILVRTVCPDRCMSGAFLHRYNPENKEAFGERCRYFEEYLLSRLDCIVVDIAGDFLADGNHMKYGLYVSYERLFYRNMGRIMKKILSGKSEERRHCQSEYRLVLQRYRTYYPAAYHRREEDLLLDRSCAINRVVRALNPALIEQYEECLIALERLKCRDYKEMLAWGDFRGHEGLKSLVLVLQEFEEECYSDASLEVLAPLWGKKTGIERQIQEIVWDYYEARGYIGRHLMPIQSCRVYYTAMVNAMAENYTAACDYLAGFLPAKKKGLFRKRPQGRQEFGRLVSEYGQRMHISGADVWGNRMTKQIFTHGPDFVSHEIAVDMLDDNAVAEKMKMLWSNSASCLVFDIYWVADTVGKAVPEEEIVRRLAGFMEFALSQYGRENILFHRIKIRTECSGEAGEETELPGAPLLREKAEVLEKYQCYLLDKYKIACLSLGDRFTLCDKSETAVFGINYRQEYFEAAYEGWEAWKSQRSAVKRDWGIHENFVTAYPMLNLGDDLFLHMLLHRYPEQTFTLYVKNQRLKDCYGRYKNLEIHVCDSPMALKKCRNHILIGGSMFIENVGWGVKYANQYHVINCAKNNYLLGANFGPYSSKEYLEFHQRLFEHFRDICFRENYSWKRFAGNRVRVAPDIIFGYEMAEEYNTVDRVVISAIQLKGRQNLQEYKESYDCRMAELCREFLQAGTEVVLLSFCRGEGDEQAAEEICARLSEAERGQIHRHSYLGDNFNETIRLLAESSLLVGTRFHAVVLGLAMEKTVYPVIYSDKTRHMLEDLEFGGQYCRVSEMENLTRNAVLGNQKHSISLERVRANANKQFFTLDKLFGKGDRR